tara:strand:- start:4098 stop:4523 length:426 start_codon:yes stop_codon:yes gene_type:complete
MNDITDEWKTYTKSDLIKGLKKFLGDNKIFRSKADGYKNLKGNGLERPVIEGNHYSWNQFARLPRDVVIVYCFMKGCNLDYLRNLKETDWFNKDKNYRKEKIAEGWVLFAQGNEFQVRPPGFKLKNEKKTKSKGFNVRGRI